MNLTLNTEIELYEKQYEIIISFQRSYSYKANPKVSIEVDLPSPGDFGMLEDPIEIIKNDFDLDRRKLWRKYNKTQKENQLSVIEKMIPEMNKAIDELACEKDSGASEKDMQKYLKEAMSDLNLSDRKTFRVKKIYGRGDYLHDNMFVIKNKRYLADDYSIIIKVTTKNAILERLTTRVKAQKRFLENVDKKLAEKIQALQDDAIDSREHYKATISKLNGEIGKMKQKIRKDKLLAL